ncbi:uncharacterized protein LOC129972942 isoform X2 [Argiope bruennichi]|uniref:Uncharacterized protein n=1 Tax=Argiope bruennichi TaxID=94029 RepID=A0A8T0F4G5_ARGBR|nr:uncharacterized protein LOC129972942 isoform X2 [Argiope bruennichi]KAF8786096.1 hypothetical protein HNY73_007860 [Argiope bruennichi]
MNSAVFLIFACLLLSGTNDASTLGDEKVLHGGHGVKEGGIGAKDQAGTGYGGHKGGVKSTGYSRGFSYGTGHDTGKSVSVGDEEFGGKGFGDKEFRGYGLGGLGYGGLGFGTFRAPFLFFR